MASASPARHAGLCFLLLTALLLTKESAWAQQSPTASAEIQLATAVDAISEGRSTEAVPVLTDILSRDPACCNNEHGAAAYWLGKALTEQGRHEKARQVWRSGVEAMHAADWLDIRLADAFLSSLTPALLRAERPLALKTYESIIYSVDDAGSEGERDIYRRYAAEMEPLLSDESLNQLIEQPRDASPETWTFADSAGAFARAWWSRLDPIPSTETNERMEEHVARSIHARQAYRCPHRASGLDDRGITYIRFGEPRRTKVIDYEDSEFREEVFRFGVAVAPREFPDNELWRYDSLADVGYYIFTENNRQCYESSGALDLLPSRLYQNRGRTDRAQNISYSALMALRYIFSELALFHPDFSPVYSEISRYATYQESRASAAEVRDKLSAEQETNQKIYTQSESETVGTGLGQTRTVSSSSNFGIDSPVGFVRTMATTIRQQDHATRYQRSKDMPRHATDLLAASAALPVSVRTPRFLNSDGSTRVEVYWGVQTSHLRGAQPAVRPSMLMFSAVQYDAEHESTDRVDRRHFVDIESLNGNTIFASSPISFDSRSWLVHLGLEWSQFEVRSTTSGSTRLGKRLRQTTIRADSLRPIRATPDRLAMSDLRAMVSPSGTPADAIAFPFSTIGPDTPLLLYFELYHLAYDEDDQTRYTISYEVEAETQGGWTRLFGDDVRKTSTEAEYTTSARRTEEYIYLDLTQLRQEKNQDVRVTVRATDTVTGVSASRTTEFELVGSDALK
ncbi:hypothetical protein CRI94_11575 [Longibacter salinarum]|uniref:GWxTD domain-containing protein n=1 Tax=Longibacter salinarum TaxID=1850348 RepID=A0A2A8CX43_9BACT|nr:GWxTD domain-containing protein [Longibacter salinarum]PEN13272.1 hypothetical protein CRI94_11575 [Longibacter salinarum]